MNVFTVPCGLFIFTFLFGAGAASWYFKHCYINPLLWRIEQIEQALQQPAPEPVVHAPRVRSIPLEQRNHVDYVGE